MGTIQFGLFMMLCFGVNSSSSQILQRHKRNWIIGSFLIYESYRGSFPYSLGTINVEKNFTIIKLEGQGVTDEPKGIVQINKYTGELTVYGPVDHEKFKSLKLRFQAKNTASGIVDTKLGIDITIIDENDNAPQFDRDIYQTTIEESTTQGTDVITIKATDEDGSERNRRFDLRIVSTTPKPQDVKFYLTQAPGSQFGRISFKGCLDHEKAEKYFIVVEAKDGGLIQLSSSCTVIINIKDGNNHVPVITRQTGPVTVKEGQENVLVTRLQVTDGDTKGTEAWRARFQIHGDANDNFIITTDADTNEGLLYVKKQLNYELDRVKNVTIAVENDIPFHSCKVESRNAIGLWGVSITSIATGASEGRARPFTTVTVTVEDVNEPPVFDQPNKTVHVRENAHPGQFLCRFTARDPDDASANTVVYRKGHDPAGVMKVDRSTGNITLVKAIDRESHYVKDNIYVASVCAVDDGKPPMTSTATLSMYVADENDNAPSLNESSVDMCQSDRPSRATVTALDLDEEPYDGPFTFRLLGDVEGKWRVDPTQGYSVSLLKEDALYSGRFELSLEVSDLQGKTAVRQLTVTVCSCLDTAAQPNCRLRKPSGSRAGHAAMGIILLGALLFAGLLLLAFMVSCKNKIVKFEVGDSGQHLMNHNTEKLGTDCEVNVVVSDTYGQKAELIQTTAQVIMKPSPYVLVSTDNGARCGMAQHHVTNTGNFVQQWVSGSETNVSFVRRDRSRWSMGAASATGGRARLERRLSARENCVGHRKYSRLAKYEELTALRQQVYLLINKKLNSLQAPEAELGDYAPRVYAEEGDEGTSCELDAISNPDMSFNLDFNSDVRFNKLASICMPSQITASSNSTPLDCNLSNHPSKKP